MKRRIFYRDILNHCYQRTADGGVLFYTVSDYLVYFTVYCLLARKHNIQVLALCQMPDHIHDAVRARRREDLEMFKRETNTQFSRMRNAFCHVSGAVFESPFGSAPKLGDKKARTNIIYIGNNPVERQLVQQAESYRWNYLAYAVSSHPFSEKLVIRNARWPLQKAVKEVKTLFKAGRSLNYPLLHRLFSTLDKSESYQLIDFIVSQYNIIDYQSAVSFFDSYDDMLSALHATTGSEYDLNEVFIGKSDAHYSRMTSILLREGRLKDIHDILSLSLDDKYDLFLQLRRATTAPSEQIAKFLHMPLERA